MNLLRYAPNKLTAEEILKIIQGYGVDNDTLTPDFIEYENENLWAIEIKVYKPNMCESCNSKLSTYFDTVANQDIWICTNHECQYYIYQ